MRRLLAIAAVATLAACATQHGTQAVNDFGRWQQLQPGTTTKPQLFQLFGQPHEVTYSEDDGSTWTYYQVTSRTSGSTFVPVVGLFAGGSDMEVTRADFHFDTAGVFTRSERIERNDFVNTWVGIGDAITPTRRAATVEAEMARLNLPFDRRAAGEVAVWADQVD